MEGLAFPLCLLRCLISTLHAHPPTTAAAVCHSLTEGIVAVLLSKHLQHKGLGKGPGLKLPGQGGLEQQQMQLSAPSSPASAQVSTHAQSTSHGQGCSRKRQRSMCCAHGRCCNGSEAGVKGH